jgi:anti-sigma28 factor (negative regulator of flagellin synthesis)
MNVNSSGEYPAVQYEPSPRPASSSSAPSASTTRSSASPASAVRQELSAERPSRVAALAQAVASGQYQPDPQKIAERMVAAAALDAELDAAQ